MLIVKTQLVDTLNFTVNWVSSNEHLILSGLMSLHNLILCTCNNNYHKILCAPDDWAYSRAHAKQHSFAQAQSCQLHMHANNYYRVLFTIVSQKRAHGRCSLHYAKTGGGPTFEVSRVLYTTKCAKQCKQWVISWAKYLVLM